MSALSRDDVAHVAMLARIQLTDADARELIACDFAPAQSAPITTIGWRLVHVIVDNEISWG